MYVGVILTYSFLFGTGAGLGFSVTLAVAATWFPKHRGLVVGLVVSGYGMGSLVFGPIQTRLINPNNVPVNNFPANMVPYIMGYIQTLVDQNISNQAAIWLSAIALAVQGIAMPIGGIVADKLGFRLVVALSCLATSGGVLLTYFTIQKTYIGVIITYSVLMGSGLGLGYSVVLATAASWFPKRRGLIVGMVVGGFGLGALVFTPIQTALINPNNVQVNNVTRRFSDPDVLDRLPAAFLILGGILLTIQVIGFAALRPKPKSNNVSLIFLHTAVHIYFKLVNIGPKQVFRYIDFYLLWCIMFCDIIPVTIITSAYKLFGQTFISDDRFLSAVATASSLFNCAGRIIWGAVVDRVSFKIPMCTMLITWGVILITFPYISLLTGITLKVFYAIWVLLLFFSLSGTFVIQPAATGVLFGSAHMAVNYGLIFSAFTVGSILCAIVTTFVSSQNAYLVQFTGCGCVCLFAFFVALWIKDQKMPESVNCCRLFSNTCQDLRIPRPISATAEELERLNQTNASNSGNTAI
ncbi:hypothetical protein MN116_001136 [Schistosoma mekongi]|uniref:Major facilitator superfamily (MFS) profile domain-containing protein n=1 Tax=Schistosoma mekongi TaxID=38744 RepID=A0AAE1ZL39_SCHME|nr:hypothetical protein MN116_001136 [Schistosoma mekongi]